MEFKEGDILFFKWNNPLSWMIGAYNYLNHDENKATHIGIIGEVKDGVATVYEAISKGFVKSGYEFSWLEEKINSGKVLHGRSKLKLTKVHESCEKYLGRPYGWSDIFFITISFFTRFKINLGSAKALICSEAVARVLYDSSKKKLNLEKEYDKHYGFITPMDIYDSTQINLL